MPSNARTAPLWLPHAALIATFFIWGYNNVPMKIGGAEWNPVAFNGFRFAIAAAALWIYTAWYAKRQRISLTIEKRDLTQLIIYALLSSVGLEVSLSYALQYSTAANGALLGRGMIPVWTGIFAIAAGEMALTPRLIFGTVLAMAGTFLIVSGSGFGFSAETLKGDAILFLRSVLGAVYLIGMRRMLAKYPVPLLLSAECTISALVLLPFAVAVTTAADLAAISVHGWWSLGFASLIAFVAGYLIHNWGLARLGAFKASVYGYLLPVTAALSGFLLLGEIIRPLQAAGAAAVLLAMYIIQRQRRLLPVRPGADREVRT